MTTVTTTTVRSERDQEEAEADVAALLGRLDPPGRGSDATARVRS